MVFYSISNNVGLDAVFSSGDGQTIFIRWFKAYPSVSTNKIGYNIYYSTEKENVFSEGVKYFSYDDSLEANIIDLNPGQEYFFSVRPVEYNPSSIDVNELTTAYDALKIYPSTILRSNITATSLIIPVIDVDGFPPTGLISVGIELMRYSSVNSLLNNLIISGIGDRGLFGTEARLHMVDGYDGYRVWDETIRFYIERESKEFDRIYACQARFEYPNYAYTEEDGYYQVTKDLLTTDLSLSDESNIDFPMYDYSGYHRTDPLQLLTGICVGSYIGGEQGCIDEYGNVGITRGLSLQDQNNQRQEMLLRLTGREAILIKRMRTGIRCACYQPSAEYPDDRCPKCFAAGTLVNSEFGLVPIETLNVGDKVLSTDGYYYPILQTFKTPYNGKLKSITTSTTTNPILTTPDHPFLKLITSHKVARGCGPKCNKFIADSDGKLKAIDVKKLPSGRWHARVQVKNHARIALGTFDTKEEAISNIQEYKAEHEKDTHTIEWSKAETIKNKDWLVCKWSNVVENIQTIKIPQEFCKNTILGEKRIGSEEFVIDEEFMWIIGLFLAEGSTNSRSLQFSLHEKEIEYQNKVISFFEKYGFNPKLRVSKTKGVVVEINGTSLANWFPILCGKHSHNKKVPQQFMNLSNKLTMAIVQGVWDGDGSKRENEIVQTSEILCLQIAEILHRNGFQPLITQSQHTTLTPKGNKRKMAYRVNWEEPNQLHDNRRGRWKFHEQLLTKVKNVEDVNYDGYVYNLEVAGDHTYVVQNIAIHNCHGSGFVIGYEQYFNPRKSNGRIMIRFGPTEENVKMYEAGLESEFPIDCWSLVVPTIKTRDILVFFDQDGVNEEYRYEVMGVSRNNTIDELMGVQKFRAARIRKTDPAYQVRVFRDSSMFPSKLNTSIGGALPAVPFHTHTIVLSEKITSTGQINQTTSVDQGHNHQVVNGVIQPDTLGHSHTILLP